MIRNRILLKTVAVFLIIETLASTVAPTISWALTAGPTAPEATSFEPVDTTDMVNTITGDFTYNIPLLEVPGPAGGYPLSLSYHAGIQPGLDASWVGLGWTLNPGSISRIVNGVPDDYNANDTGNRVYWEGGTTTTSTYGVSFGIGNVASVSAGLVFANDTYKGRGIGGYMGLGASVGGENSTIGVNGSVGISPYGGGTTYGLGLGISKTYLNSVKLGASVGISYNAKSGLAAGVSGGVSVDMDKNSKKQSFNVSMIGASIGSRGNVSANVGMAGLSASANNSGSGNIQTQSGGFNVDIPVYYGVNVRLGREYTRYWIDSQESFKNYGSLYFPDEVLTEMETRVFDTYHLQGLNSISRGDNSEKYMEGSFADYDVYSVNAQGLGGNIRPYHYNLSLASQDIVKVDNEDNVTNEILDYYIPPQTTGVRFRFVNDFSNAVINDGPEMSVNKTYNTLVSVPGELDFNKSAWETSNNAIYEQSANVPIYFEYSRPDVGKDSVDKQFAPNVAGSKHVEYFSYGEIRDALTSEAVRNDIWARGFIECNAKGFKRGGGRGGRSSAPRAVHDGEDARVGAFAITNESGVTYHFSLPAESFQEFTHTQNKNTTNGLSFNDTQQKNNYAYTWYLTAVTGPDFVDRGPEGVADGKLDENDWGYWVEFQYGFWTGSYRWRNPDQGFNEDLDGRFKTFSMGVKNLYYLNAIKTKTHTAVFVKEMRVDGKSVTSQYQGSVGFNGINYVGTDAGGYDVILHETDYERPPSRRSSTPVSNSYLYQSYFDVPVSTLALKYIELYQNSDLSLSVDSLAALTTDYHDTFEFTESEVEETIHFGKNVVDVEDGLNGQFPHDKALRKIDLNYDYSLVPGTSNSFDEEGGLYDCEPCVDFVPASALTWKKHGKLTLRSLSFKGKGGIEMLPPIQFGYDLEDNADVVAVVEDINSVEKILEISLYDSKTYQVGDIVVFNQEDDVDPDQMLKFYGYVSTVIGNTVSLKMLSSHLPETGKISGFKKTKNPPYDKEFYDIWGMYKVDFEEFVLNRNVERYPTSISSKNADVWSLRTIRSSLGGIITVNYESDDYSKSVVTENLTLKLTGSSNTTDVTPISMSEEGMGHEKVFLEAVLDDRIEIDFTRHYKVGDFAHIAAAFEACTPSGPSCITMPSVVTVGEVQEVTNKKVRLRVYVPYTNLLASYNGVLFLSARASQLGGGIRVSSIGLTGFVNGKTTYTDYSYKLDSLSSGVTSYEPIKINDFVISSNESLQEAYAAQVYRPFIDIMSLSREIPAPAVYYGTVTVKERIIYGDGRIEHVPGSTEFTFETFSEGMVGQEWLPDQNVFDEGDYRDEEYAQIKTSKVSIRDFSQRLGSLKRVRVYDDSNRVITETINHYLHDEQTGQSFSENSSEYAALLERYDHQGTINETFSHARWIRLGLSKQLNGVVSSKATYPSILVGSSTINYKTGITTSTSNVAFDFYSGSPSKILMKDGYGNNYVSENIAAYRVYDAFGPPIMGGKNMLSQSAASINYKVNDNMEKIGLLGYNVETWSDSIGTLSPGSSDPSELQEGVWRMHRSFSFIGEDNKTLLPDGTYPLEGNNLPEFKAWWFHQSPTESWQKNAELTLYDVNSHGIEMKDVNSQYAATKFTYDFSRILATVANAEYWEFAYGGAEESSEGDGQVGGNLYIKGIGVDTTAHTGNFSLKASNASQSGKGFLYSFVPRQRVYHVSVWSSEPNGKLRYTFDTGGPVNDATVNVVGKSGDWYLLEADIPVSEAYDRMEIWCATTSSAALFDDFRVHPVDAAMLSYVYNKWGELSHILDNNNMYTEYLYDNMGRLKAVNKETFKYGKSKVSETEYHYANH